MKNLAKNNGFVLFYICLIGVAVLFYLTPKQYFAKDDVKNDYLVNNEKKNW